MSLSKTGLLLCECGKVNIQLSNPNMKYRINCCCDDCLQRLMITAGQNNNIKNRVQDILSYKKGVDLCFFDDLFIIDDNMKTLLQFEKINGGRNIHMITKCCGTMLCGTNPLLEPNTIWIQGDVIKMNYNIMATQIYLFTKDWTPKQVNGLQKETKYIPVLHDPLKNMNHPLMGKFVAAVSKEKIAGNDETIAFKQLLEEKDLKFNNSFFKESRSQNKIHSFL